MTCCTVRTAFVVVLVFLSDVLVFFFFLGSVSFFGEAGDFFFTVVFEVFFVSLTAFLEVFFWGAAI
jgi:hypothetical protein